MKVRLQINNTDARQRVNETLNQQYRVPSNAHALQMDGGESVRNPHLVDATCGPCVRTQVFDVDDRKKWNWDQISVFVKSRLVEGNFT